MSKKSISPLDVYALLPRTNCKECGEPNCMAFAARLINREVTLEDCPPLKEEAHKEAYAKLWGLLKPSVREVTIGVGDRALKIGGKYVMYRHELTYYNPTAIAIDVTDETPEEELMKRLKGVEGFSYEYIGQRLRLDLVAVRSVSNDPEKFGLAVEKVVDSTALPLILCSLDPDVIEGGLKASGGRRPLVYAATRGNWREMADIALAHDCPLSVSAPKDLKLLRSMVKTLTDYGVEDLVLDPGTFLDPGLEDTINNFTLIRRAACKEGDALLGFPLIGAPIVAWAEYGDVPEIATWKEACLAAMLITRYADLIVMHSLEGWSLLPTAIFRQNLYTDPRKPISVEPGLRRFGTPDEGSPVMLTTNFALTYYTVASDIEGSGVSGYLLVVDTEGISVESAVAGRKLTAIGVAEALKGAKVESIVRHRRLIIPGRAARLSGEIEETTGWEVHVGPLDSSGIPKYLEEKWPGRGP